MFYCKRNGGMLFWRVGVIGGSLYLSRKTAAQREAEREQRRCVREFTRGRVMFLHTQLELARRK